MFFQDLQREIISFFITLVLNQTQFQILIDANC